MRAAARCVCRGADGRQAESSTLPMTPQGAVGARPGRRLCSDSSPTSLCSAFHWAWCASTISITCSHMSARGPRKSPVRRVREDNRRVPIGTQLLDVIRRVLNVQIGGHRRLIRHEAQIPVRDVVLIASAGETTAGSEGAMSQVSGWMPLGPPSSSDGDCVHPHGPCDRRSPNFAS